MSNAAKLKKKAVELEQKKQLDKALALYIQFLQESDGAVDDIDIPLYNRVGDLLLRMGNASDALNYCEQAVDLYAERGFLNNAIALCNKVLRQSPGRASIYYKLGKISANKGFKSDAKKNFLEYADRMQKTGHIDEAFRALKEFADLCPDQDDIRLMLAEQLTKENRQDEALEQLQKLHDKLDSEGRSAEARATVDRMKSIDPEAVPRTTGSHRKVKSPDLIFLDTSFEDSRRSREAASPTPAAPTRHMSDPDLVVLTMGDQSDTAIAPLHDAAVADGSGLGLATPNEDTMPATLPLLDLGGALPPADALLAELDALDRRDPLTARITPLDIDLAPAPESTMSGIDAMPVDFTVPAAAVEIDPHPASTDLIVDAAPPETGPPLSVDYAGDLSPDVLVPGDADGSDLFDFRRPPKSDDDGALVTPVSVNLDPDVAFPSFDLGDVSLPSADEVTSGASLAAALGGDAFGAASLSNEPFTTDSIDSLSDDAALGIESSELDLAAEIQSVAPADHELLIPGAGSAEELGSLDMEWSPAADAPAPSSDASDALASIDDYFVADTPAALPEPTGAETPGDVVPPAEPILHSAAPSADVEMPIEDFLEVSSDTPAAGGPGVSAEHLTTDREATPSVETDAVREPGPRASGPLSEPHIERPQEASPPTAQDPDGERLAGWEVQRSHAERLLESGDRTGGVYVLEQVAAELERIGDLERALTIVDELIRLSPDSIRHHQKRVELAFRANDRGKLIDAYLELGDALFRSGEERKARAVYQRVLELAPDDPRARSAVESVSSMSPPAGSGAIPAIPAPQPIADARPASAPRPPGREPHVTTGNGAHSGSRISAPQARKPSPLDRSAAANGEFVDLGEWLRAGEGPKSTRMVAEEKPPTGDEQADFQEMLTRFKQGIADNVDDEDYESHYDLGIAYKEMGLMDEAVAEFQKALRGTSNRVRSYEALGQCFVEKEQYQVAASVLSRAIALGEGDDHHLVGVLYLLGRATEALGRHGDALDYYQRVFAVDIEFRDVAERISAIERKAT
jgi:tetratricopeptide (TPR) repeat protein